MSIIKKIESISKFVEDNINNDEGKKLARDRKMLASEAIRYGMRSRAWEKYMREFAKDGEGETAVINSKKLTRLIGEDDVYNRTEWSYETLAYIVANSTCDVATTVGTGNGLTKDMKDNLDFGFVEENPPA